MNFLEQIEFVLNQLENPTLIVPGIYFSRRTGKFFEVEVKKEHVKPKYVCGGYGPKVSVSVFKIQYHIYKYYELVMEYDQ